ncbi:MAG: protein-L-isoaspartate(D-aspartate) O-methyltransferase [Kiritimatiellae bacterium]|nr:protein-L-isoaspartate(D-aspartate) O-methyltransferase [Kiritimatiellia bacterium]
MRGIRNKVFRHGVSRGPRAVPDHPEPDPLSNEEAQALREAMVEQQIQPRGIADISVLSAMRAVPRHLFVPESSARDAYRDCPLPIGLGQTISQPYIVALMTELAQVKAGDRVLEIGTGSGYQTAILAEIAKEVFSVEIVERHAVAAAQRLAGLGYNRVKVRAGDGYQGWPEFAPFDAILVTAGAEALPRPLLEQLKPGGRLIIPVGPVGGVQSLRVVSKDLDGSVSDKDILPVRFVPFTRPPTPSGNTPPPASSGKDHEPWK